jgi:hypothetical protein
MQLLGVMNPQGRVPGPCCAKAHKNNLPAADTRLYMASHVHLEKGERWDTHSGAECTMRDGSTFLEVMTQPATLLPAQAQ